MKAKITFRIQTGNDRYLKRHTILCIALKNKLQLINSQQPNRSILDIGAGTGDFLAVKRTVGKQ
jgi:ubiquinone/menaquinone biosynthesis C-methylase UbiE